MYPAGMAVYWFMAGACYYLFKEGKLNEPISRYMPKHDVPMISLMVPCYNEGDNLDESIPHLLQLRYPNYELIFINDGSKDNTGEIIDRWAAKEKKITALHQENQGKASALNHGLTIAKGKYVACIDGDAVLDYYALDYMVQRLSWSYNRYRLHLRLQAFLPMRKRLLAFQSQWRALPTEDKRQVRHAFAPQRQRRGRPHRPLPATARQCTRRPEPGGRH